MTRATGLFVLLVLTSATQAAVSSHTGETADAVRLAGKTPVQLHSSVLVYHQPVRIEVRTVAGRGEPKTSTSGGRLSVASGNGSGKSAGAGGTYGAPQRSPVGSSPSPFPRPSPGGPDGPAYDRPDDPRALTMNRDSGGSNPCSRSGYHDNVMSHGLDSARVKCELHALDNNRWALWGLAGGDPLLHRVLDKQLDRVTD